MNPYCLEHKARTLWHAKKTLHRAFRRHLDFSRKKRHILRRQVNGLQYILEVDWEKFNHLLLLRYTRNIDDDVYYHSMRRRRRALHGRRALVHYTD